MFSVVDAVLLRPLPFKDADRIFILTGSNPKRDMLDATILVSAVRPSCPRAIGCSPACPPYTYDSFNLTGDERPEQLPGVRVSASFFDVLGVPMAVGPGFTAADDVRGAAAQSSCSAGVSGRAGSRAPRGDRSSVSH